MNQDQFLAQLAEILEAPASSLQATDVLSDLENWDSLAMMNIIALATEQYGVTLSPRQIAPCNTVADLMKLMAPQST